MFMTLGTPDGRLSDVLITSLKHNFHTRARGGRLIYTRPKPQQEGKAAEWREESLARGVTVGTGDWQADRGQGEGDSPPAVPVLSLRAESFIRVGRMVLVKR